MPQAERASPAYETLEVLSSRDAARAAHAASAAPNAVSELAVFRAVLAKNWALKWRGCIACCSGARALSASLHALLLLTRSFHLAARSA
jgi:hypothetical protein